MGQILIINYPTMKMGGIEVHLCKLVKFFISRGVRVIWYTLPNSVKESDFEVIPELEVKCVRKTIRGLKYEKLRNGANKNIVMLSFDPLWYLGAEVLRRNSNAQAFTHYMVLPHFAGAAYYPELNGFTAFGRNIIWRFMRRQYSEWDQNKTLKAFEEKQYSCCAEHYDFAVNESSHVFPYITRVAQPESAIERNARSKAANRSKEFRILVCARLDFPHKGYVLGMIDVFKRLKEMNPNASLVIAGDGPSRKELEKKINALPIGCRESVLLLGTVTQEELAEQFSLASVNPNLAGTLYDGAICGVPSLVMRHYSNSAECYGYFEDISREEELRSDAGESVQTYLEELISMSDEEYVSHCIKAAQKANEDAHDPSMLFCNDRASQLGASDRDIRFSRFLLFSRSLSARVLGRNQFDSNE